VFWCICTRKPETRNFFFKKDIFYRLEWLKMCFNAFAHISRPPETFLQKIFFWPSGVLKNVFWCICAYFQTTRNLKKKNTFYRLKWLKTCFHFHAFAHTSRTPETFFQKIYFLPSGVGTNVFWFICTCFKTTKNVFWCICTCFQTTSNFFSKKIFFTVWSG
jgi:hypothetical protein